MNRIIKKKRLEIKTIDLKRVISFISQREKGCET